MAARRLALVLALAGSGIGASAASTVDAEELATQLEAALNGSDYDKDGSDYDKAKKLKEKKKKDKKELKMAFCVIDAVQAGVSLGQAGVGITEATHSCKPKKNPKTGKYEVPKEKQAACAETITFILTTFGHVAVFLSGAASQCAKTIDFGAYCAVDVADMITGFSLLSEAGSSMAANCKGGVDYNDKNKLNADAADGRRLAGGGIGLLPPPGASAPPALRAAGAGPAAGVLPAEVLPADERLLPEAKEKSQEEKDIAVGMCVFDVLQAGMFLARAGALIEEVVHTCEETERVEETYDMENDNMETNSIVEELRKKSEIAAQDYLDESTGENPGVRRLGMLGKAPIFNITAKDVKHMQRICSVNVLHLIASFAYVGSFLSYAATKCPEWKDYNAACAGGIINVITSLSIVSASGLDMENACAKLGENETDDSYYEENPTARRLSDVTRELGDLVV